MAPAPTCPPSTATPPCSARTTAVIDEQGSATTGTGHGDRVPTTP
ncbi:hypothetical protein [Streptomyces sp. NPDC010273]